MLTVEVDAEFIQGLALSWLLDQLAPTWGSRPERSLGDVIKIEPRRRDEGLARELHKVGIRISTD